MRNPEFGSEKEPDVYKQAERFTEALDRLKIIRQSFFIERGQGVDNSEADQNKMFVDFEGQFTEHILQLVDVSRLDWHPIPEHQETMENDATGDLIMEPNSYCVFRGENSAVDEDSLVQSEQSIEYSVIAGRINQTVFDVKIDIYDEERSGSHLSGILFPSKHITDDNPVESEAIELDGYKSKALADTIEYVVDRLSSIYKDPRWHINPDHNNQGKFVIEEI
jgi:hypothetical protein